MKRKLLLSLVVILLVLGLTACGLGLGNSNRVKMTEDSDSLVGKNYEEVINTLTQMGFTNIEKVEKDDLTSSSPMQDGEVESISIDGKTTFSKNDTFTKESNAVVTYHIVKRLNSPLTADKIASMEIDDVATAFSDAGFINVKTEEIYDIDPDSTNEDHRNEVVVGGKTVISDTDSFKFDSEVRVICHYPFEKYEVKIKVDFVGNLLFSKYDVILMIDDTVIDTLAHGQDYETTVNLKAGTHEIVFYESDDASVNGKVSLDVDSALEASYKIDCTDAKVNVETVYIEQEGDLSDDEVRISGGESSFKYHNYKDVEKELSDLGFSNIKTEPKYDIVFGVTSEGEVESVTIDGRKEYKRGDVFKKNAEIVITYHMPVEDDPNAEDKTEDDSDDDTASDKGEEEELIYVTAKDLYKEMQDNQVACKKKYDGKKVLLYGKIEDIGTDILDDEYITLVSSNAYILDPIQCYFKSGSDDYIASLSKGQEVYLVGTVDIGSMFITVKKCEPADDETIEKYKTN